MSQPAVRFAADTLSAPTATPGDSTVAARARRWTAAVATGALLALGATPGGADPPPAARPGAPVVLGCDRAAERVQVTASSVLDPACTYTAGVDIRASDVTLDCRGALIQQSS